MSKFALMRAASRHRLFQLSTIVQSAVLVLGFAMPASAQDEGVFSNVASLAPELSQLEAPSFGFAPSFTADEATEARYAFSHLSKARVSRSGKFETQFDAVAKAAMPKPSKLAKLFARAKSLSVDAKPAKLAAIDPLAARLGKSSENTGDSDPMVLAYASPNADSKPLAAIAAIAPTGDDEALNTLTGEVQDEFVEFEEGLPDTVLLPNLRPEDVAPVETAKPEKPGASVAEKPRRSETAPGRQQAALARPESPAGEGPGIGEKFRNLFSNKSRAGNGVAIYDISAKKVFMPDGSVLTAYSGMGRMANNPRFTHVRMNGPTPVHTYNLRMRESLFHGVQAIRMLPVDGRNKHGRDGFLAHSQLVRGQQSHGCVAFPQYDKFLRAFKQGKVKQIVVVASGGRAAATRTASN